MAARTNSQLLLGLPVQLIVTAALTGTRDPPPQAQTQTELTANWPVLRRDFVALPGSQVPEGGAEIRSVSRYDSQEEMLKDESDTPVGWDTGQDQPVRILGQDVSNQRNLHFIKVTTDDGREHLLKASVPGSDDASPFLIGVAAQSFVATFLGLWNHSDNNKPYVPAKATQLLVFEAVPGLLFARWVRSLSTAHGGFDDALKAFWILLSFAVGSFLWGASNDLSPDIAVGIKFIAVLFWGFIFATAVSYVVLYTPDNEKDPMGLCHGKPCHGENKNHQQVQSTIFRMKLGGIVATFGLLLLACAYVVDIVPDNSAKTALQMLLASFAGAMLWATHLIASDPATSIEWIAMMGAVASSTAVLPATLWLRHEWLFKDPDGEKDAQVTYGAVVAAALACATEQRPR